MSTYTEWTEALELELSAPFPDEAHKTKRQGGSEITFVSWHEYAHRLNVTVGPQNWSADAPILHEVGGKLVMGVPVTILGVTKVNVGDEDEDKDSFGTASTNAWAQAFKRSCALFGIGLYMYDKSRGNGRPAPSRSAPRTTTSEAPASAKQLELIDKLQRSSVITEGERDSLSKRATRGMSKAEASKAIDWLTEEIERRKESATMPAGAA